MIKHITNDQMKQVKTLALEYLKYSGFGNDWLNNLTDDFNADNDQACHTFELARYISWHMQNNGIHINDVDFARLCAFEAVMYGLNQVLVSDTIKFPTKPFDEWTIKDFEIALKAHQNKNY